MKLSLFMTRLSDSEVLPGGGDYEPKNLEYDPDVTQIYARTPEGSWYEITGIERKNKFEVYVQLGDMG